MCTDSEYFLLRLQFTTQREQRLARVTPPNRPGMPNSSGPYGTPGGVNAAAMTNPLVQKDARQRMKRPPVQGLPQMPLGAVRSSGVSICYQLLISPIAGSDVHSTPKAVAKVLGAGTRKASVGTHPSAVGRTEVLACGCSACAAAKGKNRRKRIAGMRRAFVFVVTLILTLLSSFCHCKRSCGKGLLKKYTKRPHFKQQKIRAHTNDKAER